MMLSPGLPPCNSDPHMVEQVILNLISNALEAMEKMLDEMSDGQRGSLKFQKGSSKDDLFGDQKKE
jgi:nitrogen-specific signal transduction histidine kinase